MTGIIEWVQGNWEKVGIIAIAIFGLMQAIRKAIDSTPETDDNWFEKLCTIFGKSISYLFGKSEKKIS